MKQVLRRDEGQVLGLALVFLVFVALVLAATLTAAASTLHATQTLTQQRDERYAAEAGILAAAGQIQQMQVDATTGGGLGTDPGAGPSTGDCDFNPGSNFVVNSMTNVRVTCTPRVGSGAGTDVASRPPYSVLALPESGAASNEGVIGVNVSKLQVFGPVGSRGACELRTDPPTGPPTPLPGCDTTPPGRNAFGDPDPGQGGLDPRYAPRSTSAPTVVDPVSSCDASTATFSPGTYTAPPSITGCNKPWWFKPGAYYFDFTNPGSHVWTINNTVVGGIPKGWTPTDPGQTPSLPGSCRTEHDLAATDGVQFVFGGDSRMQIGPTGAVELCAQPSASQQQIAVYGMTPAVLDSPNPTDQFLNPDPQSAANGNPPYVQYDHAKKGAVVDDGQEALAPIPAAGAASISVSGFQLPAGSIIQSAQVNVVHHEEPAVQLPPTQMQLSLDVQDGAGNPIGTSGPFAPDDACNSLASPRCLTSLDITTQLQNDPTLVNRLSVSYTATAPPTGGPYNSFVDGFQLHVTFYPPTVGYRQLAGCTQLTLGTPSDPQQPCPMLSTVPGAQLYVQGTVYAPTGGLDVNGEPDDPVRFNRGIIARTVVLRPGNGGAPPGVTAGGAFDREVVLEAYVNDKLRLVASVSFGDVQAFVDNKPTPKIIYNTWDVK